jgi:hypothetical protein
MIFIFLFFLLVGPRGCPEEELEKLPRAHGEPISNEQLAQPIYGRERLQLVFVRQALCKALLTFDRVLRRRWHYWLMGRRFVPLS